MNLSCQVKNTQSRVRERVNILGVGVSVTNLTKATNDIAQAVLEQGRVGYVTVTGAHGIIESTKSEKLKEIHNGSYLSVPDGVPTVWIGKFQGHADMARVYGPDLMAEIFIRGEQSSKKIKHFLWGASPSVVAELEKTLLRKYPNADIIAAVSPPYRALSKQERFDLLEQINLTQPHFFWVGLSTPKQEEFMHDFLEQFEGDLNFITKEKGFIMLGVGAAFDFHAGKLKQAPSIFQNAGMEWLFRVLIEPKRLWKRYLIVVPTFLCKVIAQLSGFKKY